MARPQNDAFHDGCEKSSCNNVDEEKKFVSQRSQENTLIPAEHVYRCFLPGVFNMFSILCFQLLLIT